MLQLCAGLKLGFFEAIEMQEEAYPVSGQIEGAVVMPWGQLYGGARRFWWGGPRTGVDRGVVEHVNIIVYAIISI